MEQSISEANSALS